VASESSPTDESNNSQNPGEKKGVRREIPGNLPYTGTYGGLSDALRKLVDAERPQHFNESFMDGVLGIRGGSSRPIPPILKRTGLLNSDNSPTDLYSKFKSASSRPEAALTALKNGFGEIFRRNDYAHRLADERIKEIIVEITGLQKSDNIVGAIFGTFNAFNEYARNAREGQDDEPSTNIPTPTDTRIYHQSEFPRVGGKEFNLVNTINIVLPETTDVQVYNVIFKSLRDNLLQ
jgi:hypothetical protein